MFHCLESQMISIFYTFYKTAVGKELVVHASPDSEESSLFRSNFLNMHTKILAVHPWISIVN